MTVPGDTNPINGIIVSIILSYGIIAAKSVKRDTGIVIIISIITGNGIITTIRNQGYAIHAFRTIIIKDYSIFRMI
jgi:hypothetical protein